MQNRSGGLKEELRLMAVWETVVYKGTSEIWSDYLGRAFYIILALFLAQ